MVFRAEVPKILKLGWRGLEKLSYHGNRIFIAIGVLSVQLSAYQVSMVSATT